MAGFFDPFRDLDRFTSSLFDNRGPRVMPVDVFREGDHYLLSADLPGVDPGSIDIDVDGQLLTIRAERTSRSAEGAKWILQERPAGSFLRQMTLGEGLDREHVSAHYDNGVLSVMIPVSEQARPRKVPVTSSAAPAQKEIKVD